MAKLRSVALAGLWPVVLVGLTGTAIGAGFDSSVVGSASGQSDSAFGASSIDLPGFYPNLEIDTGHDDNVYRSQNNRRGSTFFLVKPDIALNAQVGRQLFRVGYQGDYARYASAAANNYSDHKFDAAAALELGKKLRVDGLTSFKRGHDSRDMTGNALLGLNALPLTEWNEWDTQVKALYGRRSAMAQIGIKYEHVRRNYLNNNQSVRNLRSDGVTLTGFYNVGPKTQLLIEPSYQHNRYPNDHNTDNNVSTILAGVAWEATAKTAGQLKVGYSDTRFNNGAYSNVSGLAFSGKLIWKPLTYSKFVLSAGRRTETSNLVSSGTYENTDYKLDWTHRLSGYTKLIAGVGYERDAYSNAGPKEKYYRAYLGWNYAITRNFTLGARYDFDHRTVNIPGYNYDDNRIMVGVKTTFQ